MKNYVNFSLHTNKNTHLTMLIICVSLYTFILRYLIFYQILTLSSSGIYIPSPGPISYVSMNSSNWAKVTLVLK